MAIKDYQTYLVLVQILLLHFTTKINSALLKDVLTSESKSDLIRLPRDAQYRYDRNLAPTTSQTVSSARPASIKPEDSNDARDQDSLEKRCARCDSYYYYRDRDYYRNPAPYDSRGAPDDRYDDRYYKDRDRYYDDRYRDRYYDDYDRRYYDSERRYNDYDRDKYDRRPEANYDRYDKNSDRYDRINLKYYDRDRYDRGDLNRYYDRYYDRYDRVGYRPWDETTRGSSGFDNNGRGYYFSVGRPEYGSGYASNWNYSRDDDKDRGWREQGFGGGSYRTRDPFEGYRGTSYLYARPSSSTTTELPIPSDGHIDTDHPQTQGNTPSG